MFQQGIGGWMQSILGPIYSRNSAVKLNSIHGIITIKLAINSFCLTFLCYWLIIENRIVKEYK